MSPLPNGWIECNTPDVNHTITVDFTANTADGGFTFLRFGDTQIGLEADFPLTTITMYRWKDGDPFGSRVTISAAAYDATGGTTLAPGQAVYTIGPLTVGVTIDQVDDALSVGRSYRLRYRLFTQVGTLEELTCDGVTVATTTYATEQEVTAALPYTALNTTTLSVPTGPVAAWNARITNQDANGESYPHGDHVFRGGFPTTFYVPAPYKYTLRPSVRNTAGAVVSGSVTGGLNLGSMPVWSNGSDQACVDWESVLTSSQYVGVTTSGDWSAGVVALPAGEDRLEVHGVLPRDPDDPDGVAALSVEIESPVTVLISGDNFTGTGPVALSGTGNQTWTVSGAGARVERILRESWRDWNNPIHGDYEPDDDYTTTKHDYYASGSGDDVWGWSAYGFLEVELTAPGSATLTFEVTWVTAAGTQIVRTYPFDVTSGTNTYRIDLIFPDEQEFMFGERVDEIAFEGFATGVYTLVGLELVAVLDAYLKMGNGPVLSQDGSFAYSQWDDDPVSGSGFTKDYQNGYFNLGMGADSLGGSPLALGDSMSTSGATISELATEMNRMEGITATYDASGLNTAFTDGSGNTFGLQDGVTPTAPTRFGHWLHDNHPYTRLPANAPLDLEASPRCHYFQPAQVPAGSLIIPFKRTLGSIVDVVAASSTGGRCGSNCTVYAKRNTSGVVSPSDPIIATGNTDASGYAVLPFRNGLVSGSVFYCYLEGV